MSTAMDRLRALLAAGEKVSGWPVDVDRVAGNILFIDTRRMEQVGVDDDGDPIGDVAGGQEPLTDGDVDYLLAAANARNDLALLVKLADAARKVARWANPGDEVCAPMSDVMAREVDELRAILAELEAQ